jgi:hypothetical protein
MNINFSSIELRIKVWEWFERNNQAVSKVQFLLAVEYFNNYGYALDIACPLAIESYKIDAQSRDKTS